MKLDALLDFKLKRIDIIPVFSYLLSMKNVFMLATESSSLDLNLYEMYNDNT